MYKKKSMGNKCCKFGIKHFEMGKYFLLFQQSKNDKLLKVDNLNPSTSNHCLLYSDTNPEVTVYTLGQ